MGRYDAVGMGSIDYAAAGIGGNGEYKSISAGNITIKGGTVTAIGGACESYKASSIGIGYYQYSDELTEGTCNELIITGGSLKADNIDSDNLSLVFSTISSK